MQYHRTKSIEQFGGWRSSGAIGAFAAGALALGAYAIGALAIGRLAIGKARVGNLEIDRLTVRNIPGGALFDGGGRRDTAMNTAGVAEEYVSLCRRGAFDEAVERFFSADHLRLESLDMRDLPVELHGMEAAKKGVRGFAEQHEIHDLKVDGPLVGGTRFAVSFAIDATFKPSGRRATIRRLDLYTVQDGAIVRSEVYYNTPPLSAR
ncbi:nuclear transport factor 2 family protein [Bradyrhizobium sp. BRP14]|nr:nuclear transport factor 2 family protein [Bradyrhizobium sp. BRP14]